MQRNSVWSVLPFFGLSVGQIKKKKKKIRCRSFCAKTAKIFLEQPTHRARAERSTRCIYYIYRSAATHFLLE
jgi:hypothetical protein